MSQVQWQADLSQWFAQVFFIAAFVVAIIYIGYYDWEETVTGRAVTVLLIAIVGALLERVLIIWKIIRWPAATTIKQIQQAETAGFWNDFFTWLSVISLGAGALALIVLGWEILRGIFQDTEKKWLCKLLLLGRKFPDARR